MRKSTIIIFLFLMIAAVVAAATGIDGFADGHW